MSGEACAHCGGSRDVRLFGNDPQSFPVKRGIWGAGSYLCSRCVRIENRRALRRKTSPRWTARILRRLRRILGRARP